jgi:hypothetical protein
MGQVFVKPALRALAILLLSSAVARAAEPLETPWREIVWGASSDEIARHFGTRARRLATPIDFGDSYVDVVLRVVKVGDYTLIAFFQMDKRTRRLKRVQLERQRHGIAPRVVASVLEALQEAYGPPDRVCDAPPNSANAFQRTGDRVWLRDGDEIRLVFRDTTFDPGEGCAFGGGAILGACGLPGQILVRVTPAKDLPTCD